MQLRRFLPKGLYPRSILIVVVPIVLLLSAVSFVFYDSHWQHTSRKLSQSIAGDIALVVTMHESKAVSPETLEQVAREHLRLPVRFIPGGTLPDAKPRSVFTALDNILMHELNVSLDSDVWIDVTGYRDEVDIQVDVLDGVLQFQPPRDRTFSTTGHIFIFWVIGATVVLVVLALGFLRNQVRSILNLAEAATAFGNGRDLPDYRPSGASEVRAAARAVIRMKDRLTAFADQRTAMLAGVSHDLRTPLTRLKLYFAMQEADEDIRAASADLEDMSAMLDEYLAFARGESGETPAPLELHNLVGDAAGSCRVARIVGELPQITIKGRALALKRALTNLIDNACTYGETVDVTLHDGPRWAEILVDDDGPGIPESRIEEAFRPFARLNEARSQNDPGVGLGLALSRDTARGHGGDITLERSPLGGLRARLRLPKEHST